MQYYRYRSGAEISFKELIYNEIYFSSPEECNDPYDSKTFYEFPQDLERWQRLLNQALHIDDKVFKSKLVVDLAIHICSNPPKSFEEINTKHFLNEAPLNGRFQIQTLINMEIAIRQFIGTYIPATRYFACFSKTSSDMLMWSHYANNHKGFCLIFKAIENKLKLNSEYPGRQIRRNTPKGIAQQMSYTMPDSFEFDNVDYRETFNPLNAFKCMSQYIFGQEVEDQEQLLLRTEQNSHFLQKELSWKYENESRLVLEPPPSWLFGGHVNYTTHERLFHYQPTQLVGVITGARMSQNDKDRLIEIIHEKKDQIYRISNYPYVMFDFVIFEAKLSLNQRAIEVLPMEILGGMPVKSGEKTFDERLKKWQDGWGLHFDKAGSCQKIQIS